MRWREVPTVLPLLYQLGVRAMTLTHSTRSWAGDGCEVAGGGGLTGFGRQLLEQMNELGVVVDVSHLNEPGFWDVAPSGPKLPSWPPIAAAAPSAITRANLRDEQLRALAEKGGVVAITFVPDLYRRAQPHLRRPARSH